MEEFECRLYSISEPFQDSLKIFAPSYQHCSGRFMALIPYLNEVRIISQGGLYTAYLASI